MLEKNLIRLDEIERLWKKSKLFNFYFTSQSDEIFLIILDNPSEVIVKNNVVRANELIFTLRGENNELLEYPKIPRLFEKIKVTNDFSNAVAYLNEFTKLYIESENIWYKKEDEKETKPAELKSVEKKEKPEKTKRVAGRKGRFISTRVKDVDEA